MANFNWRYSNAKKQTYNGRSYRSRAEANYARDLDRRVQAGEIKFWKYEKPVELKGENGTPVCKYKIDFTITHLDDTIEFVEVKGFVTPLWRLKWKLFKDKFKKDSKYKITLEKV